MFVLNNRIYLKNRKFIVSVKIPQNCCVAPSNNGDDLVATFAIKERWLHEPVLESWNLQLQLYHGDLKLSEDTFPEFLCHYHDNFDELPKSFTFRCDLFRCSTISQLATIHL